MENFVYIYNEYYDRYAFEEMVVKIFGNRINARKHHRKRILEYSGKSNPLSATEIEKSIEEPIKDFFQKFNIQLMPEDVCSEELVIFSNDQDCRYWQIIERSIE